jgi:hypothetical protein
MDNTIQLKKIAQKIANKKYYDAHKDDKIKKVLTRYNALKEDEDFKRKKSEYMKAYNLRKKNK